MKKQEELKRSFGGKTQDFEDNKERNLEQKHLKAYLKGNKRYTTGYSNGSAIYSPVKEIWS